MSDRDDNDIENDFDDFEESGFDDLNRKGTLGDLWRNNPFVKIGIILAAIVFVIAGIILFGGSSEPPTPSRIGSGSDVTEAPGSAEISQAYRDAIEETNMQQTEEAIRQDSSVVPMPVAPPVGVLPQTLDPDDEEDPLDRWRRMQEERIQQQQLVAPEPVDMTPPPDTRTPAVNALSQAMATQMQSVLSVQEIKGPNTKNITTLSYLEALENKRLQQRQMEAQLAAQQNILERTAEDIAEILVPAGTIEYAQLITEANTDAPGPVLAQIQSGPLKGARVLGSFNNTEEYLTLNFNMVVVDGVNQSTSAVALDPGTTLPGLVTDIDRRYWKRIVLPTAAAFIEGLSDAIATSDTTTVTIIGDSTSQTTTTGSGDRDQSVAAGVSEAGSTISDIINEEANRTRPMLKIRAGTPIGILFMQPVLDKPIPMSPSGAPGMIPGFFPQQQQPYFAPINTGAPTTPPLQGQGINPYSGLLPTNSNANFFSNSGYFNPIGQTNAGSQ